MTIFDRHHRSTLKKVGLHLLAWLLLYFLDRHYFAPRLLHDNAEVVSRLSLITWLVDISVYYGLGHFVFPRYLYTRRIPYLIGAILLVFQATYLINYFSFRWVQPYSDGYGLAQVAYVEKIWHQFLKPHGLLGCFTHLPTAFWSYSWSLFIPTVILFFKGIKDITQYRNRALRLERDKYESDRKQLLLEKNNLALELDFLRSQINPHFLFNTLNSLYVRVIDLDDEAAEIVLKLSDLMRYNLYESNVERITVAKELEFIQNYLLLERARHGQRVEISYTETGDFQHHQIAPLLLISLVENAFKHGASKTRDKAFVRVEAHLEGSTFTFRVENSVSPLTNPAPQKPNSGGVGLVNTRKRLDLLYPDQHQLALNAGEQTYTAELILELEQQSHSSLD